MGELLGFVGQQYALSGLLRLSFGATDVEGGGRAVSAGRARNCHFYPALPWRAFTYRRFTAGVWRFYSAGFPPGAYSNSLTSADEQFAEHSTRAVKPAVRSAPLAPSFNMIHGRHATMGHGRPAEPSFGAHCRDVGLGQRTSAPPRYRAPALPSTPCRLPGARTAGPDARIDG